MNPALRNARVIALIDMDCFYCQVEQREKPELWGKPVAVVQYNQYQGGGIIAMSYEARAFGVIRRGMRGDKAKELCPELTICRVPLSKYAEKAELEKYRNASAEVFEVLCNFDEKILVERASIDEAYLDLTAIVNLREKEEIFAEKYALSCSMLPTTHIANGTDKKTDEYDREDNLRNWLCRECQNDPLQLRLAIGAEVVEGIRAKIKEKTQFHCSAGIATNKILAKLVCSRHKPRQQTIIAPAFIPTLFESTKIGDIRGLGGKLGHQLAERYGVKFVSELAKIDRSDLAKHFPHSANFIELVCQGIDEEPVKPRDKQLSIAVSRNFPGKSALVTVNEVKTWLRKLVNDLCARLATDQVKNKRTAQSLSCGCVQDEQSVRTTSLKSYDNESVFISAWTLLKTFNKSVDKNWLPPVRNIHVSAHHFREGIEKPTKSITSWLKSSKNKNKTEETAKDESEEVMEVEKLGAEISRSPDSDGSFIFEDEEDEHISSTNGIQEFENDVYLEEREEGGSKGAKKMHCRKPENRNGDRSTNEKLGKAEKKVEIVIDDDNMLPASLDSIDKPTLDSMPPAIRKDLIAYYDRKKSQDGRWNSTKKSAVSPANKLQRALKAVRKITPKKSKTLKPSTRKINDFFKKL